MSDRIKAAIGFAVMAAMAVYCARALEVSTEITHFLPGSDDRRLAQIARNLADSDLTRTLILSIEAPDQERAIAASKRLAAALRKDPEVARVVSGPDPTMAESYYRLFFPHRFQMISGDPERELPARFSDQSLAKTASELKGELSSPMGALFGRLAAADPLVLFREQLRRLEALRKGPLDVRNGAFVTSDGHHAILFLATASSPFDSAVQGPFLERLRARFAEVAAGTGLKLRSSGVNRFAVDTERIVKNDINRVSTLSTVAIIALFLVLFRSFKVLAISFIPVVFGMLAATSAGLLVYGKLHGLTLAFGSTLLGVCVDYPILYLNHHVLEPHARGPWWTLRRITFALLLGAFTTVAGFAGLAWTSFPGMREIALFATAGILGALASSCWLLPALVSRAPVATALHRRLALWLGRGLEALRRKRELLWAVPVAAVFLCAIGLPRLRWADDLSALQRPNPQLLAEDEAVRAQVSRMDSGRFILSLAPDDAAALALNDLVYSSLAAARRQGLLEDFRSLHDVVFSPDLQRRNQEAVAVTPRLFERAAAALAAQGFNADAFSGFGRGLQERPAPLTLREILDSPLGDLVRPFRVELGGEVGVLTLVRGVRDSAALAKSLPAAEGVRYFDQGTFLAAAYGKYRARTGELMLAGVVFVFVLLFAGYRRVRPALAAGLPAILAAATTLAVLALLGVETNLLHLISLLLVLSIGEDYAIFLVASLEKPAELEASAMSVALCCLSAVLSFGLLSMSEIPALRDIGLTTGLGVLLSLVLAPTALALLPREDGA